MTAGDDEQQKRLADDEGSNEEGGKGDGNGDKGGGRETATMVKKRVRVARAMVTRVVGEDEGNGDGGNMARNNRDGLVPVVVQQPILVSASASLDDTGDDKSTGRQLSYALRKNDIGDDQMTTRMTMTLFCCDTLPSSCLMLVV